MAEFMEVVREGRRMCAAYPKCKGCPIYDVNCETVSGLDIDEAAEVEREVMNWAAANTKPSWADYLKRIGVIQANTSDCVEIAGAIAAARIPGALLPVLNEYAEEEGGADD